MPNKSEPTNYPKFNIGDFVAWEVGWKRKKTMVGQVYLVVPPKRDAFILLREKDALVVMYNDGAPRAHESYIVGPFGTNPVYKHTYYWPRVTLMRKVEK